MDRTTFTEALLADYIARVHMLSREELIREVIELKHRVLKSASDGELTTIAYEQRNTE